MSDLGKCLSPLGRIVSAACDRDLSADDRELQVKYAHTDLYKEIRNMGSVNAELLEALSGMIDIYGVREQHMDREPFASLTEVECCNRARAAIAKAMGVV